MLFLQALPLRITVSVVRDDGMEKEDGIIGYLDSQKHMLACKAGLQKCRAVASCNFFILELNRIVCTFLCQGVNLELKNKEKIRQIIHKKMKINTAYSETSLTLSSASSNARDLAIL